jgi:hypothetical protein
MLIIGFLAFTCSSCYHVYYAPNTPNVTQFTEKNEARISLGLISGFDSEFGGGDLQFAYAPAEHVGFMVNGFSVSKSENTINDRREKGTGSYGEFGIGYFNTIDKKKEWTYEIYGGLGAGGVKSDYGAGENSKVSVSKLFLQPAIGYKWDYLELAFAPRFAYVNWKVKQMVSTESSVQNDMEYIRRQPDFFSFEPGLILRGGGKGLKAQIGMTVGSGANYLGYDAPRESIVGYIGLSINLSSKTKAVTPSKLENR